MNEDCQVRALRAELAGTRNAVREALRALEQGPSLTIRERERILARLREHDLNGMPRA